METSVKPLFFKEEEVLTKQELENKFISQFEVMLAAEDVISFKQRLYLDGAQIIDGLWRIYFKNSDEARIILLAKGITIRNRHVVLYDRNPFVHNSLNPDDQKNEIRVTIKDIPLSFDNTAIDTFLKANNVKMKTGIRYCYIRNTFTRKLTDYKNGDRYLIAEGPITPPINRKSKIGRFRCRIYHDGQEKLIKCSTCGDGGHKAGSNECPHYRKNDNVQSFAGYENPLSNFYKPKDGFEMYGRQCSTAEQAWVYYKAKENKLDTYAEEALNCAHAGKAFQLSRRMADKLQPGWDNYNMEVMETILIHKAEQCPEFQEALRESGQKLLAHCVPDKYWGTGLSDVHTMHTNPTHWPGDNAMGNLLMKIRDDLYFPSVDHDDATSVHDDASSDGSSEMDITSDDEANTTIIDNPQPSAKCDNTPPGVKCDTPKPQSDTPTAPERKKKKTSPTPVDLNQSKPFVLRPSRLDTVVDPGHPKPIGASGTIPVT